MTASVQVLFVGTQGQTPTDRVPAAPVQSGLSAILRHRKEVHGLQPHRHFPHLTTDSFDRRRLHKWKLLRLTLLLLAVSILRRLRRQHDPAGREISAPKTWSYDVEVNCGRLVSCRLRSLVFFRTLPHSTSAGYALGIRVHAITGARAPLVVILFTC